MPILCLWQYYGSGSINPDSELDIVVNPDPNTGWRSPYPLVLAIAVLWIRIDLVPNRTLLSWLFPIRVQSYYKLGQFCDRQISRHFKALLRKSACNQKRIGPIWGTYNFAKIVQILIAKIIRILRKADFGLVSHAVPYDYSGSGSDLAKKFRIPGSTTLGTKSSKQYWNRYL
jgi:hypothetical protein